MPEGRRYVARALMTSIDGASQTALRCTMPASNPRLTITLKATTAAQLRMLSELTGNSQSALIAELLEANEETFGRLITILQAANAAKAAMSEEAATGLRDAQRKLEKQLGLTLDAVDLVAAPLIAEAERVARRGRKRGPADAASGRAAGLRTRVPTPMSNRGVRSTAKTTKKPTATRT